MDIFGGGHLFTTIEDFSFNLRTRNSCWKYFSVSSFKSAQPFLLPSDGKQVKTDPRGYEGVRGKDPCIEAVGRCTQVSSCPCVPHFPWGGDGRSGRSVSSSSWWPEGR